MSRLRRVNYLTVRGTSWTKDVAMKFGTPYTWYTVFYMYERCTLCIVEFCCTPCRVMIVERKHRVIIFKLCTTPYEQCAQCVVHCISYIVCCTTCSPYYNHYNIYCMFTYEVVYCTLCSIHLTEVNGKRLKLRDQAPKFSRWKYVFRCGKTVMAIKKRGEGVGRTTEGESVMEKERGGNGSFTYSVEICDKPWPS